jgi:hypothetical protein
MKLPATDSSAAQRVEVADTFRRTLFAPYASELLGTDDEGTT